jgi:FkbM family methyltransferase
MVRTMLRQLFPRAMHARARSHSKWQEIEEELLPIMVDPMREAVDVGANVGRYAVALSRIARRVYAYEPDKELADFLAKAAPANVIVFAQALSDGEGLRPLRIPVNNGVPSVALASIDDNAKEDRDREYEIRMVQTSMLDRLADRDIGFVKIDVEGHELKVLAGARNLIERQRPVVLVEVEERRSVGSLASVTRFFEDFGYAGFFVYGNRSCSINEFSVDMQEPEELLRPVKRREMDYTNNFLFAPSLSSAADMRQRIDAYLG